MPAKKDLTGMVFGKLTVIEEIAERQNGRIVWKCQCECGNTKIIRGSDLTSGKTKSCGCNQYAFIDLTNQKFTRLTPLYALPERYHNSVVWHCKCDCGAEVDVSSNHLRTGRTKSCGCYNKEQVAERSRKDLTGQIFGLLTAIEPTEKRNRGSVIWKCKCQCGNFTEGSVLNLTRGDKLSCGCLQESYGVYQIKTLLSKYKINFIQEKHFSDCVFPKTNGILRFDFYVDNSYIIEYDGKQHFKCGYSNDSWNTLEHLEKTKERDAFKNDWCKQHNVPLIRIPYTEKEITIEDLMLDTSKYRVC